MRKKDTASLWTRQDANREIPIYYSTVPRMRPHHKVIATVIICTALATCVNISIARAETAVATPKGAMTLAQAAPPSAGGRRSPPPREAIKACASQAAKSACAFAGRDGQKVTGTCQSPEVDVPPACVPAHVRKDG